MGQQAGRSSGLCCSTHASGKLAEEPPDPGSKGPEALEEREGGQGGLSGVERARWEQHGGREVGKTLSFVD